MVGQKLVSQNKSRSAQGDKDNDNHTLFDRTLMGVDTKNLNLINFSYFVLTSSLLGETQKNCMFYDICQKGGGSTEQNQI